MKFGFRIVKEEFLEDIKSNGFICEHDTGAKLVFLNNNDVNKVFSVTLKTMPYNDKGIAHILEHCVLCGSKKYNIKDPVNELEKGSIHTYLNAITFNDKTIFPVASTNEKEFINLINVYLDGIFFPNLKEEIFLQEGWNFNGNEINGIVYNEVKNIFSNYDKILEYELKRNLFKKSLYKYYSAGRPEEIINLTYSELIKFYNIYYKPSNSIFYLYGNIEIDKYLKIINEYLIMSSSKNTEKEYFYFDSLKKPTVLEYDYYLYDRSYKKDKSFFASSFLIDKVNDYKLQSALEILVKILFNYENSKIKESNIFENISGFFDNDMIRPMIWAKSNCLDNINIDRYKNIFCDLIEKIINLNANKDIFKNEVKSKEFYLKDEDFGYKPRGLFYNIELLKSLRYDDISFEPLKFNDTFEYIKDVSYKELTFKYILNNINSIFIKLNIKNKDFKNTNYNLTNNKYKLKKYHNCIDDEMNIKKIPMLKIRDLYEHDNIIKYKTIDLEKYKLIYHNNEESDIGYIDFLFDLSHIPHSKISYLGILKYLIGKVSTEKYDKNFILNKLNYTFGKFKLNFIYIDRKENLSFIPKLQLKLGFIKEDVKYIFELLEQILINSLFNDKEYIKKLLLDLKLNFEKENIYNNYLIISNRCMSYFSDKYNYADMVEGIEFYKFLNDLLINFNCKFEAFYDNIVDVYKNIFFKENILVSVNSNYNTYEYIKSNYLKFINLFNCKCKHKKKNTYINLKNTNEAIISNLSMQTNVQAFNFKNNGFDFCIEMKLLERIISTNYLWENIRICGGAYDCGIKILRDGNLFFYSLSDPNINLTYKIFDNCFKSILNIDISCYDMRRYIIGTINIIDKPKKNNEINDILFKNYFYNITDKELKKERENILNTNINKIKDICEHLDSCRNKFICTVGNESEILNSQTLFSRTITIL